MIPIINVGFLRLDNLKLLFRIVYEGTKFAFLLFAECVAEEFINFAPDIARGVLENVLEGLVLSVQVGQKVFCAFGMMKDGLQIDDLGAGSCDSREVLRKQFHVSHVIFGGGIVLFHVSKGHI